MKIVFCFHTHDHEFNLGVGSINASIRDLDVETDLVVYREFAQGQKDDPEEISERILEKKPAIVAFSSMTFNWPRIRKLISLVRPRFSGLIVVGGYHAILNREDVLNCPGVDAVCLGEGEKPFTDLVTFYLEHPLDRVPVIPGMIFNGQDPEPGEDNRPWLMENLEDYPYMDYDLLVAEGGRPFPEKHIGVFSPAGIFSLMVAVGRGCPYKCTYCANSTLIGLYGGVKRFLRRYSPEVAVSHVKEIARKYRPEFLEFLDETFTMGGAWTEAFCKAYAREVGIPFSIMTRIDILDEASVGRMVDAGLRAVFFGLECGDEAYRKKYLNRKMSNEAILKGARALKRHDVMIITFNMFGMPFETRETLRATIDLNLAIEPDAAIPFIYQPMSNTELARIAYDNGLALPPSEDRWDYFSPALDAPDLPATHVAEQVDLFRERLCLADKTEAFYSRLRQLARDGA